MPFTLPQFIDREMKIFGPLTFRQLLFVGTGVLATGLLYMFLAKQSLGLFIFLGILIIGLGTALAFVKIEGKNMPEMIINFFVYFFSTRNYLWKKRDFSPTLIKTVPEETEAEPKKSSLMISKKSQIGELNKKLEIGSREIYGL